MVMVLVSEALPPFLSVRVKVTVRVALEAVGWSEVLRYRMA